MSQLWLGVADLEERFGGFIGRQKIIDLMKANHIKSKMVGRALVTLEKEVEAFEELVYETEIPLEFKDITGRVICQIMPTRVKL